MAKFIHYDPANRLHPATEELKTLHTFEYAPETDTELQDLHDFLEDHIAIYLVPGRINQDKSVGKIVTPSGRRPLFDIETHQKDLAALFKLKFRPL